MTKYPRLDGYDVVDYMYMMERILEDKHHVDIYDDKCDWPRCLTWRGIAFIIMPGWTYLTRTDLNQRIIDNFWRHIA